MQIGIIGTGNVATANYLPPLAARDDVELIYYSRTATKATAAAARFGGRTVDSIAAMVGADPDAICEALRYFLTAKSVTGQLICVDGGQHLGWETPDVLGVE